VTDTINMEIEKTIPKYNPSASIEDPANWVNERKEIFETVSGLYLLLHTIYSFFNKLYSTLSNKCLRLLLCEHSTTLELHYIDIYNYLFYITFRIVFFSF
jgi:hypothetical protein